MLQTPGRSRPRRSFRSTAKAGARLAFGRIYFCSSTISCRRYSENRYLVDEPLMTPALHRRPFHLAATLRGNAAFGRFRREADIDQAALGKPPRPLRARRGEGEVSQNWHYPQPRWTRLRPAYRLAACLLDPPAEAPAV